MDKENKHKRITNKHYRKFLDEGIIEFFDETDLIDVLNNIKGKHSIEGRALVIALYYTGARPVELLNIKAKDVTKDGRYVLIKVPGAKNGLPRTINLPYYKKPLVRELKDFAFSTMPERFLFWNYRGNSKVKVMTKRGLKEYPFITYKVRDYFKKWFANSKLDVPPYYLRHNRFSKLISKGATVEDIKFLKGAKRYDSVQPYVHMSSEKARKLAGKMD